MIGMTVRNDEIIHKNIDDCDKSIFLVDVEIGIYRRVGEIYIFEESI